MVLIQLDNVSFKYKGSLIVKNLSLTIENEQIISIMGPSGCGKSTLLRLLAGLEKPSSGTSYFEGKPLERPSNKLRFSFQDLDAFPWKTVKDNLLFGGALEVNSKTNAFNVFELLKKIGL